MRFRLHWRWSRGAGGRASPRGGGWCQKTLLPMYLTIPVTSATSEGKFSALRRLNNNLRSTMKQDRLNTCMPTDVLSQIHYGDTRHCEYCLCTNNAKGLSRGIRMAEWNMSPSTFQNAAPPLAPDGTFTDSHI